jgi:hypothetical protein
MTTRLPSGSDGLHHASHSHLLDYVAQSDLERPGERRLDAIIVPTFRPSNVLRDSLALAQHLSVPLISLCSGDAHAGQSVDRGAMLAIDLREPLLQMPAFGTAELLGRDGTGRVSDLSLKRNLGLLLARAAGWQRVLFLDDDIFGMDPGEIDRAAGLLDRSDYRAVGLANRGFPDNSVVCHAYRAVGAGQDTFIGGGAMIVNPQKTRSFFPNIYNEDWLFLLGDGVPFRAACSGSMIQRRFDPFARSGRAAEEEFGDTLAEGLFWLLDTGRGRLTGDPSYWADFLFRRRAFLDHLLAAVDDVYLTEEQRREQIKASLRAAKGASAYITPRLCDEFIRAWREDLHVWDVFLDLFPRDLGIAKAIAELGLTHVAHHGDGFMSRGP